MSGLSVGSTIAGCRLEAVAGRGGMGVVYRATQLALDRPVAVKAMAPQLAEDAAYRERFQRESQLAASIDHPNVIPVYEAGELDGTLYLMMRWVDGTDLRALLNENGGLEPARAVRLLRPVASALAAAHRRGLVHRDVKPANVLITADEDEHVYLTDFGIARRTDAEGSMTRTGVLVGTLDYTAPERIEGGKGTAASDIYAFGCMLFETVTGRIPFERPTELTKMHAHLNDPIPSARAIVAEVPASLDTVIARAMAKDPAERFESAGELVTALGRVLDGATTGEVVFRERLERSDLPTDETPAPPAAVAAQPAAVAAPPAETAATTALVPPPPATLLDDRPAEPATVTSGGTPSRRRPLALGGIALLAIAGVVIALVASGGGGKPSPAASTTTGSTTTTRSSTTPAPTGPPASPQVFPTGAATLLAPIPVRDPGAMWATDPSTLLVASGNGVLTFKDGRQVADKATGGQPTDVTVEPNNRVWVTTRSPSVVAGNRTIPLTSTPSKVAIGPTAAWIGSPGSSSVIRVDLHTLTSQSFQVAGSVASIGEASKRLWVAASSGVVTVLVDTGQHDSLLAPPVPRDTVAIGHADGVWFLSATGRLSRLNPNKQIAGKPVVGRYIVHIDAAHVSGTAVDIAALASQHVIWVSSGMTVTGFNTNAKSGIPEFARIRFDRPPGQLAVRKGILWVAVPSDGRVYPFRFSAP